MIIVCGGIKGGVGKTTLATNLAILFSIDNPNKPILLIDADKQETATDFTTIRADVRKDKGGAGYKSVALHGADVRTGLQLIEKFAHTIIDVGASDTTAQRAALSFADLYLVPFLPASFISGRWTRSPALVEESRRVQ